MSPAGAWDALARLLPAECPRRDLEAVAPSAPAGTDRAAGASRPRLSPEPARSGPCLPPEPARAGRARAAGPGRFSCGSPGTRPRRWPRLRRASYGSLSTRPHGGSLAPLATAPVLREGGRGRERKGIP